MIEVKIRLKSIKKPITLLFENDNQITSFTNKMTSDEQIIVLGSIMFNKNDFVMAVITDKGDKYDNN